MNILQTIRMNLNHATFYPLQNLSSRLFAHVSGFRFLRPPGLRRRHEILFSLKLLLKN